MEEILDLIREKLILQGLTVEHDGHFRGGFQRWFVTYPADEVAIYVLISEDMNGHPDFWCQCPDSNSTQFTTPLHVMIGDASDSVLHERRIARLKAVDRTFADG